MSKQINTPRFNRVSPEILQLTWKDKEAIYKEWVNSGLSKKRFCQQNGISENTFYGWHSRLRNDKQSNLCPIIASPTAGALKPEPIVLEISFPNAVIARVKATDNQFGFLLKEICNAITTSR